MYMTAVAAQPELAGRVAAVSNRQQRRRQERRLALSAVRVARENPAFEPVPHWEIDRIGIVAEGERRPPPIEPAECFARLEPRRPHIVEAENLEAFHLAQLVAKHGDARGARPCRRPLAPAPGGTSWARNRDCPRMPSVARRPVGKREYTRRSCS